MVLVGFVGLSIASFSFRFLKGDRKRRSFYFYLLCLCSSASLMVCADYIFLFFILWSLANFFLTRLILHKSQWEAARQSHILAAKNYFLGSIFLGLGLLILYLATHQTSFREIFISSIDARLSLLSLFFIVLTAMTQSAIWPFHRWLMSSLNSPTPVSAIMHAGIVNGGGFLLVRFAPMLRKQPEMLNLIFVMGFSTAIVGSLWKLMQSDIKRMLAASTIGQMGFMLAQCGLGLFDAAVAHLTLHGLYKAYLFLASGSVAQEKRHARLYPSFGNFLCALHSGIWGALVFSSVSGISFEVLNTHLFLLILAFMLSTQFALAILSSNYWPGNFVLKFALSLFASSFLAAFHSLSIRTIEHVLSPMQLSFPQEIGLLHIFALCLLVLLWLGWIFFPQLKSTSYPSWLLRFYVSMLNSSQPHPLTVTAYRNNYKF